MAPSPTGFLHIGGVRTFLFNWLYARKHGGELLLRIENTDTNREVAEAVDQIKESLIWLGIDWDGDVRFQLDTADKARELAHRLVAEDKAYEEEGAIRFRQPKEGTVSWDDAVRGRIEFRNELLPDLVIVRSDGRPTYNFISPVDDVFDEITHVIRGEDHVSNTPTQINILRALGAELPVYAHVPNINGDDGRKLSKRRNAIALDDFRAAGYLPAALFNFLALLGWSYDDKTTIMSRHELVERFDLDRVVPSPATFDYQKLDWLNGVYLRNLQPDEYAHWLCKWLRERGIDWPTRPGARDRPARRGEDRDVRPVPGLRPLPVRGRERRRRRPADLPGRVRAPRAGRAVGGDAARGGASCARRRAGARSRGPRSSRSGLRSRAAKISPGLFESLELLGKEKSLARLGAAYGR